jgi:hypothetical protein
MQYLPVRTILRIGNTYPAGMHGLVGLFFLCTFAYIGSCRFLAYAQSNEICCIKTSVINAFTCRKKDDACHAFCLTTKDFVRIAALALGIAPALMRDERCNLRKGERLDEINRKAGGNIKRMPRENRGRRAAAGIELSKS